MDNVVMHPQTTVDQAHALCEQGVFDREVALIVGVPLRTVRNWRTGRRRAPGRGAARVPCPRCADEVTLPTPGADYANLLGLYLGDGHIVLAGDRSKAVWRLSVWCADDWPGLVQECARAMRRVRRRWGNRDHWCEYPRYLFVNKSEDILQLCGETLDRLGVERNTGAGVDVLAVDLDAVRGRHVSGTRRAAATGPTRSRAPSAAPRRAPPARAG
jgi:hypothetical protein